MYSQYMDGINYIDQGVIFSSGAPVGLLAPSTIFGTDEAGRTVVSGRRSIEVVEPETPLAFWNALTKSDSIIFGDKISLEKSSALFTDPIHSRTLSYISTISTTCEDLLRRFAAIQNAKVLIIGCGGIGSLAAVNLAGAGVKLLTVVDDDAVELSNLNRQFFWSPEDCGKKKVKVLESILEKRAPNTKVSTIEKKVTTQDALNLAKSHDIVLITADEPLGLAQEIIKETEICVIHGGYFHSLGGYSIHKGESFKENKKNIKWLRSPHFIGPSFGPSNTEIAGAIASACIHYLMSDKEYQSLNISSIWNGEDVFRKTSEYNQKTSKKLVDLQNTGLRDKPPETENSLGHTIACKINTLQYPKLVGLLHQENTPPGSHSTLGHWITESKINSKSILLDLACSTGFSSRNIVQLTGCTASGVDIEETAVQAAAELAVKSKLEHLLSYKVGDAALLPYLSEEFSHVIAGCTFAFISQRENALEEVHRVIMNKGKLCVANFAYTETPPVEIIDSIERLIGFRPSESWTEEWWLDFFQNGGFELESNYVQKLVPFRESDLKEMVRRTVYEVEHKFSDAEEVVKKAVYDRFLEIRHASNNQRKYQSLLIQTWRKK